MQFGCRPSEVNTTVLYMLVLCMVDSKSYLTMVEGFCLSNQKREERDGNEDEECDEEHSSRNNSQPFWPGHAR